MAMIDRNFTFATNGTVSAADLHNLIDSATIYQDLITGQLPITSVGTNYELLIADATNPNAAPNAVTVYDLFEDALTAGTYTNANISAALTYGTATGTRLVSANATITTGTITTGVIPTLTSSTATFGTTTSTAATITSGTIATLNSTTGTIANLASTTGTIGNLSTTLAGDFTISQGTGTLGTSGVTLGTYGGATSIPVLAIDAKGRITTASTSAITSGFTGFRNRIINGDMRIDQRNAGASVTATGDPFTLDRWRALNSQAAKFTVQQNAGSVTPPAGFANYLGATSSSAYSITSSDYFFLRQVVEGFNTADLAWGTASAATVTLSFRVYSSLTGTFGGALQNNIQNRSYPFSFSIPTANTWTTVSLTVAGDTTGTWATNNTGGIYVVFGLGVGSTYSGTAGAWAAGNYFAPTGATSVVGTNGATFYITGVQLEAGSTATDFERRPIGTELALCQRYFEKTYDVDTAQATATNLGMAHVGSTATGIYGLGGVQYVSNMRSIPEIRYWDGAGNENKCSYIINTSASTSFVANTNLASAPYNISTRGFLVGANIAANSGSYIHYTANSEL